MVKALFDTNILIDYFRGIAEARVELARYEDKAISIVTWIEVMAGAAPAVGEVTERFLQGFSVIAVDAAVARRAVVLRRERRIRLPDAVIWASAQVHFMLLVSRDEKDFPGGDPGIRVPYRL